MGHGAWGWGHAAILTTGSGAKTSVCLSMAIISSANGFEPLEREVKYPAMAWLLEAAGSAGSGVSPATGVGAAAGADSATELLFAGRMVHGLDRSPALRSRSGLSITVASSPTAAPPGDGPSAVSTLPTTGSLGGDSGDEGASAGIWIDSASSFSSSSASSSPSGRGAMSKNSRRSSSTESIRSIAAGNAR